jgi:hypothetical protein
MPLRATNLAERTWRGRAMDCMTESFSQIESGVADVLAPAGARPGMLDKRLVHKTYDDNVVVGRIDAVRSPPAPEESANEQGRIDHFRGILLVDASQVAFFESDCSHVPGLLLVDAAEQVSIAIVHMFYKVPFDIKFVLTDCSAQFRNVGKVNEPLIAEQTMTDHVYRRGRLVSMRSAVIIRQGSLEIARLSGTIVLLDRQQLSYLEQR